MDFDRDARDTLAPDIGADEYMTVDASIIPPLAIDIVVLQSGLAAAGAAPPTTGPVTGPGVLPGPAMAPQNLNPLPGDPLNPLLDPEALVDSDGDGNKTNDVAYYQLSAGDGWATMADGTDLYTFGFSDVTPIVTAGVARAAATNSLANSINAIVVGPLANGGGGGLGGVANRIAARLQLLSLANTLSSSNPVRTTLLAVRLQINIVSQTSGIAARDSLIALVDSIRTAVETLLREIGPKVQTEGMLSANLSAPTMVFKEGQHAYLDLSNVGMLMRPDLFDPHTVHFHGFAQAASIFDGEPMASIAIGMGGTLRYYYRIVEPGTYLYHCHVEATEHMQMGMIGNLWVTPKQNYLPNNTTLANLPPTNGVARTQHKTGYKYAYNDGDGSTYYDVEAPLQVTGFDRNFHEQHIAVQPLPFAAMVDDYPLLNGRGYPDTINPNPLPAPASNDYARQSQKVTSLVTAKKGQRILLRLSNVSETDIHTITVLGIPMKVVAKDARLLRGPDPDGAGPLVGKTLYYDTTSVQIGGGETTDVILDSTGLTPGTYLLYATRLNHLSNNTEDYGGLMTEIVITP
jgi:FtsP/CotA-like multicopper oxidase with cupredoxin domain